MWQGRVASTSATKVAERTYAVVGSWRSKPTGSSSVVSRTDGQGLLYRVTGPKGERVSVDEFLPFRYTPTRFGGHPSLPTIVRPPLFSMSAMPWADRRLRERDPRRNALCIVPRGSRAGCATCGRAPPKASWRLRRQYHELRGRWLAGVMGRFGIKDDPSGGTLQGLPRERNLN